MKYQQVLSNFKTTKILIVSIKIIIICFFSIYVIDYAYPFYQANDGMVYGGESEHLANGMYGFTNQFVQRFHEGPFIPEQYVGTIQDSAIPIAQPGTILVGTIFYLFAGSSGLLFVGPVFAILLFIVSERISTKLFGAIPGLVTLILVITFNMILWIGRGLQNDLAFTLFVILGFFQLVKFFQKSSNKHILLASCFFSISALFRITGFVIFPIEIISFALFFFYAVYVTKSLKISTQTENGNEVNKQSEGFPIHLITHLKNQILSKQNKKIINFTILMFIPWVIFFVFYLISNNYYFGDYFTNYQTEYDLQYASRHGTPPVDRTLGSFLVFDSDRLDWIKYFTMGLFPDNVNLYLRDTLHTRDFHFVDNNWLSIIVYAVFAFAALIAYFKKFMRGEVFLILILIFAFLFFQSSSSFNPPYIDADNKIKDEQTRYMIPSFVLFSIIGGLITSWGLKSANLRTLKIRNFQINLFHISIFIILTLFLSSVISTSDAFIDYSNPKKSHFVFPNVDEILQSTRDELPKDGIIISQQGRWVITLYNGIPFQIATGRIQNNWNENNINQDDIKIIKTLKNEGHDFFSIKNQGIQESYIFRYLERDHGIILKNFSTNLCKLELISSNENSQEVGDDVCYGTTKAMDDVDTVTGAVGT
jgi:hypothetical protein